MSILKEELTHEEYDFLKGLPFYINARIMFCEMKKWNDVNMLKHVRGREETMPIALRMSEYFVAKLEQAISHGAYKVMDIERELGEKIEIYDKVDSKDTLFHLAAIFSDYDMMKSLVSKSKICQSIVKSLNKKISMSFMYCDAIDEMSQWKCKTNLNYDGLITRNSNGDTPLHLAVKFSNYDMVELLVSKLRTKDLSIVNNKGEEALDIANVRLNFINDECTENTSKLEVIKGAIKNLDEEQKNMVKKIMLGCNNIKKIKEYKNNIVGAIAEKKGLRMKERELEKEKIELQREKENIEKIVDKLNISKNKRKNKQNKVSFKELHKEIEQEWVKGEQKNIDNKSQNKEVAKESVKGKEGI